MNEPVKVYCERNAWDARLARLRDEGHIALFHFPYDCFNKRTPNHGEPSAANWEDLHLCWDSADFSFNEATGSDKLTEILQLLNNTGHDSRRDALHLDSAYKSGCRIFLTTDKGDLLSRRVQWKSLLNLEVLNPREEWDAFITCLAQITAFAARS